MAPWSLISPASRGIGFALARRVLQTTNAPVVATARKDLDKTKEELLEGLGIDESRLRVLKLDVLGMLVSAVLELLGGSSGVARVISYFQVMLALAVATRR
jgi:NAD(P)-dependent dehydrogenase (short-subunit alcohol dehydrogenase family)